MSAKDFYYNWIITITIIIPCLRELENNYSL